MSFITKQFIRTISAPFFKQASYGDSARSALVQSAQATTDDDRFDIFLAHACEDAEIVLGAKIMLELFGYRVYVDWVDDPDAGYSRITAEHVCKMKQRMQASACLILLTTKTGGRSKWLPWALGYFDGQKPGQVAVLPVTEEDDARFHGEDLLAFYPLAEYGLMPWKFHKTINIAKGNAARIDLDRFIEAGKSMVSR